jgi:hypothetical protein
MAQNRWVAQLSLAEVWRSREGACDNTGGGTGDLVRVRADSFDLDHIGTGAFLVFRRELDLSGANNQVAKK